MQTLKKKRTPLPSVHETEKVHLFRAMLVDSWVAKQVNFKILYDGKEVMDELNHTVGDYPGVVGKHGYAIKYIRLYHNKIL